MKKVVFCLVILVMCRVLQAQFTLRGTQTKDVTTSYQYGYLFNSSSASISCGSVYYLLAYNTSNVIVSGGTVNYLNAYDSSSATVSGGTVTKLSAFHASSITLYGVDYNLGRGLSWDEDGQTILGTGLLSGKWLGSNDIWTINIAQNDPTATILAIPKLTTNENVQVTSVRDLVEKQYSQPDPQISKTANINEGVIILVTVALLTLAFFMVAFLIIFIKKQINKLSNSIACHAKKRKLPDSIKFMVVMASDFVFKNYLRPDKKCERIDDQKLLAIAADFFVKDNTTRQFMETLHNKSSDQQLDSLSEYLQTPEFMKRFTVSVWSKLMKIR